jgi:hypothetical protein
VVLKIRTNVLKRMCGDAWKLGETGYVILIPFKMKKTAELAALDLKGGANKPGLLCGVFPFQLIDHFDDPISNSNARPEVINRAREIIDGILKSMEIDRSWNLGDETTVLTIRGTISRKCPHCNNTLVMNDNINKHICYNSRCSYYLKNNFSQYTEE